MKHLKLYESFNNIESTKEELYDLFINFEDEGWTVKPLFSKIVKDRNDWSGWFVIGNLRSTKVRNVWGGEFIDWHEEVIMSDGDKKWKAVDCFIMNMSKIHYIENLTEESIVEHWKDLDSYLTSKIPVIKERAKRLGLELFGVHGKWFQLGKASHSDYSNEPYFGWDMLTDLISFAFVPIKTNEGLFDFFKKKKPTESPKVDVLYEPIEVPYMVEYEDNHQTIPFTKSESDYIMGLAKSPSDVIYNSGDGFSANHYRLKIGKYHPRFYSVLEFIIRKYDDEWFFVTIYDTRIKGYEKYKYYKCDTFDGVKQLIANKS